MASLAPIFPGDPLPRTSAATINAIHATAREATGVVKASNSFREVPDDSIVHVLNVTGVDLPMLAVVGLDDPVFPPEDGLNQEALLLFNSCFGITWPATEAYRGRFAILLEPAPQDGVVKARVAGKQIVYLDANVVVGDTVDVDATERIDNNTLSAVSGGCASVLWVGNVRAGSEAPQYSQYGLIRFGGAGGGGGAEIINFEVLAACPGLDADIGNRCPCVQAVITRVLCVSSVQKGDFITVWDVDTCWFNIPLSLLIGRKGTAFLMRVGEDDNGKVNCSGYGAIRPGECFWSVESLCCAEEAYGS